MNMLDVLVSLVMTILMAGIIMGIVQWGSEKNLQKQAAQQMEQVASAAQSYAMKHQFELLDQTTANAGPNININTLVGEGFLPQGFIDRNVWGQNYQIYYRKTFTTVPDLATGGNITEEGLNTIVMTTGGGHDTTRFFNTTVPEALGFMAKGGAYVASGDIPGQLAGSIIGSGWQQALAAIGVPNPGPGHLASMSQYSSQDLGHDMLYRFEVPGHPELNAMQANLDMTDHAINNIRELSFVPHTMDEMVGFCAAGGPDTARLFKLEGHGFYTCRDGHVQEILDTGNALAVKDIRLVSHGAVINKPECAPHTDSTPEIFLAPMAMAERQTDTRPITAFQTYAVDQGTSWQVIIRMQTPNNRDGSWVNPPANLAQAQATIFCRGPVIN